MLRELLLQDTRLRLQSQMGSSRGSRLLEDGSSVMKVTDSPKVPNVPPTPRHRDAHRQQPCTQVLLISALASAQAFLNNILHTGLFWLARHQLAISGLTLPTACLDIITSALADPLRAVLAPSHIDGWASCCPHSAFQQTVQETPVKPLSICASAGG